LRAFTKSGTISIPLDRFGRLATVDDGKRLAHDPRVVCAGRDFIADAIAVVKRRLVEKSGDSDGGLDLTPVCEAIAAADLQDVSDFLSGKLDTSPHSKTGPGADGA
jgi:hypothetical protein